MQRRFGARGGAVGHAQEPPHRSMGRARHTRAGCLVPAARTFRRRRAGLPASTASWSSSIMLGTGWALIDACIGNSRPHSHVAHQISLAVERDLEISGDVDMIVPAGHAVAIASQVRHRLGPPGALVRSFYLDPLFRLDRKSSGLGTRVLVRLV